MAKIEVKKSPGGYILFDMGGYFFDDINVTGEIPGITAKLMEALSTGKAVYIHNFSWDDGNVEYGPCGPVQVMVRSGEAVGYGMYAPLGVYDKYYRQIYIDDADGVEFQTVLVDNA